MFIKQQEIQFRGIYFLILFSLIFFCNAFSQIGSDTIYLKKGNKVIGSIYQLYGNNVVKINTQKGKVYSFNNSLIQRIGFGYKKEKEVVISLMNGDSICGELLERKYKSYLKIKTPENRIMQFSDSDLRYVKCNSLKLLNDYIIYLKDKSIIWGTIENLKNKDLIVKNNWTNLLTRIGSTEILRIDSIPIDLKVPLKIVHLKDSVMIGYLNSSAYTDFVFLKTTKYGDFMINKNEISKVEDYIESKKQVSVNQNIDITEKNKSSWKNQFNVVFASIRDSIKIYNLSAVASFGFVISNNYYYMPQVGINMQFIRFNRLNVSSEVRLGSSTNFDAANLSINLSPIIFSYNVLTHLYLEIIPDIHMRFYDTGSITTFGFLVGGKYYINPQYSLKLKFGNSGGLYLGISGQYVLKDYYNHQY